MDTPKFYTLNSDKKIHLIKVLRSVTGMGLAEAKDVVEDVMSGKCLLELTKLEAMGIRYGLVHANLDPNVLQEAQPPRRILFTSAGRPRRLEMND